MSLTDNRTQLQDCEATGDISGDTTANPTATTNASGSVIEGTNAVSFQVDDAQEIILFDLDAAGATFNIDLSDSTVYMMIKQNGSETFANLGGLIAFSDGADGAGGDIIGYAVGGADVVGLPYRFRYHGFKLDVSVVVASPGTDNVDYYTYNGVEANLDHTQVLQVGYGSFNLTKAVGTVPNAWFDGIYYIANDSYAASILGGTEGAPETMADLVGDDETAGAGMFANPIGSAYYVFAPTEWGDSGTGTSGFEGTDEQWFLLGDNGGGHAIGASHFPMRIVGNSTGTNTFIITRVSMINTGTPAEFDFSNANMNKVRMEGCVFTDLGTITMQDGGTAADFFCDNTVFNNCARVDLQALTCDNLTFNGTTDANGAIIWDDQDNLTFNSDGTGHAIEVAPTGTGPFTYNVDGYTFDGYAGDSGTSTNRVFFINPSTLTADITINLSNSNANNVVGGGFGFSSRTVGSYTGTLTIQQTVTLTVQVNGADGNGIDGARVRIEDDPLGTLISNGTANASGLFTDSYAYTADEAVLIKVRLKGYKPFRTTGTITNSGITVTATMQRDRIVDLP
jgi:hypothetical protein